MNALQRYYTPETIQKLERLAELTDYQRYTSFRYKLTLLDWCALCLSTVEEQAGHLPLDNAADMPAFIDGLDQAALAIARALDAYFQDTESHQHLASFLFEHVTDALSEKYKERRARILERGKAGLLARISIKMASR